MNSIRVLTLEDTEKLLAMADVIDCVEKVYIEKSNGTAAVWPMVFYEFNPGVADMDIKSGYLKEQGIYGMKLVSWFGENPKKGLPALTGAVMIFDAETGRPLGLINGEHMTGMRTGAAGAIGIKYLARPDSETLLMVGAGHQAAFQITAALTVAPNLKNILVYDPMNYENAERFCESFELRGAEYKGLTDKVLKDRGVSIEPVMDLEKAVSKSDVIITATPSRSSMISKDWVKPGTHFSCMGSDMSGKQEIDSEIMSVSKVFVDDIDQAVAVGEIEMAIKNELMKPSDICSEIGDVIVKKAVGRADTSDITVFDSTGIGLQDLITGALALRKAEETHVSDLEKNSCETSDCRAALETIERRSIGAKVNF